MTHHEFYIGDARRLPDLGRKVRLTIGSPPYLDRRTYGITGARFGILEWIGFMIECTQEAVRVTDGPVLWVCNGKVKNGRYFPAVEGLIFKLWEMGFHIEHPLLWSKNATPNRRSWWSNQWEFIVAVIPQDSRRVWNWQAIATPQKYAKGGVFRQRAVDGSRRLGKDKLRNKLARPYDIIRATVGGGHMGHKLAHKNEAPYPVSLIRPIVQALTNPGDDVLDPFGGSGSTMQACFETGRNSISLDIRENQVGENGLARQRLDDLRLDDLRRQAQVN